MLTNAQAESWSRQPESDKAQRTHEEIRTALRGPRSTILHREFTDFLQGSYRNGTNIKFDSDVDIAARLDRPFQYDTNLLGPFWAQQQSAQFVQSDYSFEQFRSDTYETLRDAFGSGVKLRNKCIEVPADATRLKADVVPCIQHRIYTAYEAFHSGIGFRPLNEQRWVVNFPVQHYENGVRKQAMTNQRFKPLVRLIKNARNSQVGRGELSTNAAPSYFLQCLIYNASDAAFVSDLVRAFYTVLQDLRTKLNRPSSIICENGLVPLFGLTPEQWSVPNATSTIDALLRV